VYEIAFVPECVAELRALRVSERRRVVDVIERQLGWEPVSESRSRKMLVGLQPPWDQVRPVWQLRVGDFRVFYDVDESEKRVIVRAVRKKGRNRTEEIL
jgi:mRNA-degrading endonuclease RelE of RelBE toxin-antitoxin system